MGRKKIIKEIIEPQQLLKDEVLTGKINFPALTDIQPEPQIEPINEPIELKPTIQSATTEESESDTESIIVASKKRIISDKTKDALKKGREKLANKWINDHERK